MPFAWAAGAAAIGTIGSAAIGASASESAANTEASAADAAAQVQQNMFNQTQKNLQPYMGAGTNALSTLQTELGLGAKGAFNPNAPLAAGAGTYTAGPAAPTYNPLTAASFKASPGYQYELQQQQSAIQNSAAGRGGAIGGNSLMALQQNAQGLASQDWYNANNLNISNFDTSLGGWQAQQNANVQNFGTAYDATRGNQNYLLSALQNLTGSGQNAAANLGGFGATAAGNIGNDLIGAGNATAAGQIGVANAVGGGVNNLSSILSQYMNGGQTTQIGSSLLYDPTQTNYTQLSTTTPTMYT